MPKKILNSTNPEPTVNTDTSLPAETSEAKKLSTKLIFEPSTSQAKMKAKFWTRFQPGPLVSVENMSIEKVAEICKSARINVWWKDPAFREWFLNKDEERERLKYLFNKSLDSIENILDNPDANPNAKVNLIKMLAEMQGYLSKNKTEKFADEEVNRMNEAQLKEFLAQSGITITQETVIDAISAGDKKEEE